MSEGIGAVEMFPIVPCNCCAMEVGAEVAGLQKMRSKGWDALRLNIKWKGVSWVDAEVVVQRAKRA